MNSDTTTTTTRAEPTPLAPRPKTLTVLGRRLALAIAIPTPRASDWRQAARVMFGATAAFILYESMRLPQGYWAVFTVVIVMQGSVGGTLSASTDRMLGTIAGALIGGVATALRPSGAPGLGLALVLSIGAATLLASVRPTLKVAPVTAAIMLLGSNVGLSPERAVLYRVLEIAMGGLIGVLTVRLILPAPANSIAITRARAVLGDLAKMLDAQARALRGSQPFEDFEAHRALRQALAAVESATADAERERSSRLAEHALPAAVPRTLWRVRNDVVLVGRALVAPLPVEAHRALAEAAAALLERSAAFARDGGSALVARSPIGRTATDEAFSAYQAAFAELRAGGAPREMSFEDVGRVFSLAFALEGLHSDLADLADRIDEVARGHGARGDRRGRPR